MCKTVTTTKYLENQCFVSSKHRCALEVFESCLGNGLFEIYDQNPCKTHLKESFRKLQTVDKKENVFRNSLFQRISKRISDFRTTLFRKICFGNLYFSEHIGCLILVSITVSLKNSFFARNCIQEPRLWRRLR